MKVSNGIAVFSFTVENNGKLLLKTRGNPVRLESSWRIVERTLYWEGGIGEWNKISRERYQTTVRVKQHLYRKI